MKRPSIGSLALLVLVAAAGCASAPAPDASGNDEARRQAVERAARVHGVTVVWINAPRRAPAAGS